VDFTEFNSSVDVGITLFNEEFNMIGSDGISNGDVVISVLIEVEDELVIGINNLFTSPSSITRWAIDSGFTSQHFEEWTELNSVFIFSHNHTFVDFTFVDLTIIIEITIDVEDFEVFSIEFITPVDESVSVFVMGSVPFSSEFGDGFTILGIWARSTVEWINTEDFWDFWTMFDSPAIFRNNEALVDFTHVKSLRVIFITDFNESIEVFFFKRIGFS